MVVGSEAYCGTILANTLLYLFQNRAHGGFGENSTKYKITWLGSHTKVSYLTEVHFLQALFIGFSFYHARNTIQGLQNQMYAVMMLLSMFGQLSEQIMPQFINQREVYEARESASKIYDWKGTSSL